MQLPQRYTLAQLPTPLSVMPAELLAELLSDGPGGRRFAAQEMPQLIIKHDELTGFLVSGNKIRKLEFVLAAAREQGATHIVTCGGWQSNHCRATAVVCRRWGLEPVLLLRVEDPTPEPPLVGNYLIDRTLGATIVRISHAEYAERSSRMQQVAERLRAEGHVPFVVPEGASSGLGAVGYMEAVRELGQQIALEDREPVDTLVAAVGSGGTVAGLQLGADIYTGVIERVHGVCVCNDAATFEQLCTKIRMEALQELYDGNATQSYAEPKVPLTFDDAHIGEGYAKTYPAMMHDLVNLARRRAILLDPVYTGKAWHALLQTLRRDPKSLGERICFVHTGGTFGLFAQPEPLEAAIRALDERSA